MDSGTRLTVTGTVTGTTNVQIDGTAVAGTTYITAPTATADNAFSIAGMTVAIANGVKTWSAAGEYSFKGLVLTAKYNSTLNIVLYQGLSGTTEIKPTNTVTDTTNKLVYYYFENLAAGTYHTKVSRNGFYTVEQVHYFTQAQMNEETVVDVTTDKKVFNTDGKVAVYQPSSFVALTNAMMALLNNTDNVWYRNYSAYLTTPVFADGKQHQQTTQEEMEAYIAKLDGADDNMYTFTIGKSAKGKNIPIVIFSLTDLSGAKTLEDAAVLINGNEKLTVHYQAQIHGNEPAAGEAALATIGRLDSAYGDEILEKMNIYVIPRLNPDGSESYSRLLNGGHNANRDMLLGLSAEIQAHHYVYNLFQPELAIDSHEYTLRSTNTQSAYNDLMMAAGNTGNSGADLVAFAEGMMLVTKDALNTNGLNFSYYNGIVNNKYAATGTAYMGLRGSVSFLLESCGINFGNYTMERRVISHLVAVESILDYAYTNTEAVQSASDNERQRIVNNGMTYDENDVLVLSHKQVNDTSLIHSTTNYNYLTGQVLGSVQVTPVRYVANTTCTSPTAYVIPAGEDWTQGVLDKLDLHDIHYYLVENGTAFNLQPYGHNEEQTVIFTEGAYVIPMNQPSALILSALLEPDMTDEQFDDNGKSYGNLPQTGVISSANIFRYVRDLNEDGMVNAVVSGTYENVQVYLDGEMHLISAAITKLSLQPSVTGFGYKAEFQADEAVASLIASQGYSLWLDDGVAISRGTTGYCENLTLRLNNFDVENYGSTKVNAKVFMQLSNGLVMESQVVSYSMQDMVEMIAADLTKYDTQQIASVKSMLAGYDVVKKWNIPGLL